MKRLSRALFTLVSALSLLLCVTVCALWARSQRSLDMLLMETAWHRLPGVECRQTVLSSTINQLNVIRSGVDGGGGSWNYGLLGGDGRWRLSTRPASWHVFNDYAVNRFGFAWGLDRRAGRPGAQEFQWFVSLPHPFVAALFAVPPALWLSARMRDARQRCRSVHKLCVACGYDLRASAGRCPECGEKVKETATASARVVRR